MTNVVIVTVLADLRRERRSSPLLTAADGRQGLLSRSAARGRRGFPGPAFPTPSSSVSSSPVSSSTPGAPHGLPATLLHTPVPLPAHQTPRAIRVLRSPR